MSASLVIDCSMTMSWCFADEAATASQEILKRLDQETAIVPSHWFLEVANVLFQSERRKRISASESDLFLARLTLMSFEIEYGPTRRAFEHLLPLCRSHGLTSYDAAYLDVALRHNLPLASLDGPLREAAQRVGVTVLGK